MCVSLCLCERVCIHICLATSLQNSIFKLFFSSFMFLYSFSDSKRIDGFVRFIFRRVLNLIYYCLKSLNHAQTENWIDFSHIIVDLFDQLTDHHPWRNFYLEQKQNARAHTHTTNKSKCQKLFKWNFSIICPPIVTYILISIFQKRWHTLRMCVYWM